MRQLLRAVRSLGRRQKLLVAVLLLAIAVTWLAVCLILTSYWL